MNKIVDMIHRKIVQIVNPAATQGFLGEGHVAVPVVDGTDFKRTDPFILLMDDQLDLPGTDIVGGAHPHAGFEIVTLVLEGDTAGQPHSLETGSMEWLTAGSGIVHTEEIKARVQSRILQLWLVLPKDKRWMKPRWQIIPLHSVPFRKIGNSEVHVYSGNSLGLTAPMLNETPVTIVHVSLDANDTVTQQLPATYNGFLYVIAGAVKVGDEETIVAAQQVAWLDKREEKADSYITFTGGKNGARFVLYAGQPQQSPIVSKGPFIADKEEEIAGLFQQFRQGKLPHVNHLPESQVVHHG